VDAAGGRNAQRIRAPRHYFIGWMWLHWPFSLAGCEQQNGNNVVFITY
jgi:hypothetical protein